MSNTIKKTNRKNNTDLVVNWTGLGKFFTFDDLFAVNSHFIRITLRTRLDSAKAENKIAEIGCIHSGKGRPKKICATTPVTKDVLEAARKAGVVFNEHYDSIAVVSVDTVKITIDEEAQIAAEETYAEEILVDMNTDNINA